MSSMVTEPGQPDPTFDVLPLLPDVRQAVDELGYQHPTPVQRALFEPALRGVDLVVQARTGTGKTAAFGLPLVSGLVRKNLSAVQALVLCPTRELALQVTDEVTALAKYRGLIPIPVYGGAPMQRQIEQIEGGAQIVVGTPGRVLDHLRRGTFDPTNVRVLVLDESDEMLSMGFLPQINDILAFLPPQRQTLLLSATLPREVKRMAETRLRQPEFITLSGDQVGALEVNHLLYSSQADKLSEFIQMLEVENPESAVVFCNTRDQTKRVAAALTERGYAADWLNADLSQSDREKVMTATRKSELRFLVATDVASRGIDISHLTHVLNFDFPESAEAYVHRTGRTGRAGRTGTAISMVAPSDIGNVYMLRLTYGIRPVEKRLPSARELKTRAEADVVTSLARLFSTSTLSADERALARRVLTHEQAELIVAGLVRGRLGEMPGAAEEAAQVRRSSKPRPAPESTGPVEARRTRRRSREEPLGRPEAPLKSEPVKAEAKVDPVRTEIVHKPEAERAEPAPLEAAAKLPVVAPSAPGEIAGPDEALPSRGPSRDRSPSPGGTRWEGRTGRSSRSGRDSRSRAETRSFSDGTLEISVTLTDAELPPLPAAPVASEGREATTAPALEAQAILLPPFPERDPSTETQFDVPVAIDGEASGAGSKVAEAEIFVNVGRRDGASPGHFHSLLEREGLNRDQLGYVNVRQRHTFIGLRREALTQALAALNGATIAGRTVSAEEGRRSAETVGEL